MKKQIAAFKTRLTSVSKEEPLNKLSLAAIIILDIFILNILFIGLDDHTQQLTTPYEYMPPTANAIFIQQNWTPANRISKLQPLILADRNNARYRYESPFEERRIKRMHPEAQRFFRQAKALSENPALHALFLSRQKTVDERNKTESAFDDAKKSYDTQLLENIANATKPGSTATSTTAQQYAQKIDRLTGEIRSLENEINAHPGIQKLWVIVSPGDAERDQLVAENKRFQFWFPLKELIWQLVFMLPIFGVFYWWGNRSVKKDNPIQALLASHLLVIASLPIILKVIELVVDLIPKHFFKNLFKFLQSLHLMALWHYFVIFAAIGVGLALVCFIQRKVFNKQKVMQKRLAKGNCTACNKRLPTGAKSCPFCGKGQWNECGACHEETPIGGPFCIHCGVRVGY
ncbi:MAG: zinc ribbon domain-containing protein [Kiritimatiellales bacterium]|nr:zinc ribbon domain-containing protein [Kiritimatiellota bacterium]MBL7012307.1 zinc ribbon domain-containing protein [Kiritimatiellales bacterium]